MVKNITLSIMTVLILAGCSKTTVQQPYKEVRYSIVDGNKTVDNLSAKDALSKATQICNAFLSNKKVTDKTVLDCVTTKVKFKTYRIIN